LVWNCEKCMAECWRWKDEIGYVSRSYSKKPKKRRHKKVTTNAPSRKRRRSSDFPEMFSGDNYCCTCQKASGPSRCTECRRRCWKWDHDLARYKSY
jgi:hypothetical protein